MSARSTTAFSGLGLSVGGNVVWQSDVFNAGIGPDGATARQDSYYLANLTAGYRFSDAVSARLNVKNLFDEQYYSSIDFYNQGFFGEPRSVEASLRYDW